jgi:hypothetical protein
MRFVPCIYPEKHPLQRVGVSVNGSHLADWETTEKRPYKFSVVIPQEVLNSTELEIRLDFPDAVRPAEIGAGGDRRKLAMAIGRVKMTLVEPGAGIRKTVVGDR